MRMTKETENRTKALANQKSEEVKPRQDPPNYCEQSRNQVRFNWRQCYRSPERKKNGSRQRGRSQLKTKMKCRHVKIQDCCMGKKSLTNLQQVRICCSNRSSNNKTESIIGSARTNCQTPETQ